MGRNLVDGWSHARERSVAGRGGGAPDNGRGLGQAPAMEIDKVGRRGLKVGRA
jgi:hypothetical protein